MQRRPVNKTNLQVMPTTGGASPEMVRLPAEVGTEPQASTDVKPQFNMVNANADLPASAHQTPEADRLVINKR